MENRDRTTALDIGPMPFEFKTTDGLRLRADLWGKPQHPPAVLLHGGGQTRHAWGDTARRLAEDGWYAVTVDLRGHGDSDWSAEGNYGLRPMADDLVMIAESLDHSPVLIGASMGGMTALFAEGYLKPGLARGLVLVDIAPRMEASGVSRIVKFMLAHQDGFASLEEAADAIADYRRHRNRPVTTEGLKKNLRLGDDGRYYWHWDPKMLTPRNPEAVSDYARLYEAARNLRLPTLLVKGKQSDVVSDESVREFRELVPDSEFADVSGAGHMVAGDNNDDFSAAILDFMARRCRD